MRNSSDFKNLVHRISERNLNAGSRKSLCVQFFCLNLSSSYDGQVTEGGGGFCPPSPQVENVLNRPGEIGLKLQKNLWSGSYLKITNKSFTVVLHKEFYTSSALS